MHSFGRFVWLSWLQHPPGTQRLRVLNPCPLPTHSPVLGHFSNQRQRSLNLLFVPEDLFSNLDHILPMTFIRETCVFMGHVDLRHIDFYMCPGPEILAKAGNCPRIGSSHPLPSSSSSCSIGSAQEHLISSWSTLYCHGCKCCPHAWHPQL